MPLFALSSTELQKMDNALLNMLATRDTLPWTDQRSCIIQWARWWAACW